VSPGKVFLVTDHFWPDIGGLESSTRYLAEALGRRVPVEVLTSTPQRRAGELETIAVRRFSASRAAPYASMYELIRSDQADRKAVCFFGFSDSWTNEHLEMLARVRTVVDCVTFKVPSLHEFSYYVDCPQRLEHLLAADHIFCLNPAIADELCQGGVPSRKLHALANGVPCDRFAPIPRQKRRQLRKDLGIPPGCAFVFTGRFAARKRVDRLVEAFRQVPSAQLVLVGYFDDRFDAGSCFDVNASANIQVFSATHNVLPFLQAADVFVSASAAEGMPNALLEAMACGLPAVVSRIPGHAEVVKAGCNGLLFDSDSVQPLVDAVRYMVDNPNEVAAMSRLSRKTAVAEFDIERVADEYLRLLAGGAS
jgi:glycosyltransferase involved in cell wall biosynthesis